MYKNTKIVCLLACTLPMLAHAKPILLSNFTHTGVAITINQQCLPGILERQGEATYPESMLKQICKGKAINCQAQIFKGACAGEKIAEFNFNVQRGLKGSYSTFGPYAITEDYTDNSVLITEAE